MIKLLIAVVLLGGSTYLLWRMYSFYATTSGTTVQRLSAAFKNSATLLVQAAAAVTVAGSNGILMLTDFFNAPQVRDYVTHHFSPDVASAIFVGFLGLTTLARMRSMGGAAPADKFDAPAVPEPPATTGVG